MALISLKKINKHYHIGQSTITALNEIDLDIEVNDFIAITGSSGSGKSTMMNIMGCLDRPTNGKYILNKRDVSQLRENELADIRNKEIGFVFQSFQLIPRISALQNVMQPLIYGGVNLKQRRQLATEVLVRVGLENRLSHLPSELSGGQRQRVAIARALVTKPTILLADEPTGNLDSNTTADIMKLFGELHEDKQTIAIITHEPEIAKQCRRFITLKDGCIQHDYQNSG